MLLLLLLLLFCCCFLFVFWRGVPTPTPTWQSMSKGRQFVPTVRNSRLCSPSSFQDENTACGLNPEYFAASTTVECVSQGISGTVARSILLSCRIDTVTGIIHSEASWHFPGEATLVRRREICIQVIFLFIKMPKVPSVVLGLICGGLLNRNRARESYICAAREKVLRYDVSFQCCEFTSTETVRHIRDGEPRIATSTFTQLLNSDTCCSVLLYVHRNHQTY